MPAPRRRGVYEKVEYVVVEREGASDDEGPSGGIELEEPTATVNRILRRSYTRRQEPVSTDADYDSDDEDDDLPTSTISTAPTPTNPSGPPAVRRTPKSRDGS